MTLGTFLSFPFPPLPSSPLPSGPLPSSSSPLPFLPLPLEVGSLKSSYGAWESAVSSPSGVWGAAPAEIKFGAFYLSNMTSGGSNFNDFPENQLTKVRAVETVLGCSQ